MGGGQVAGEKVNLRGSKRGNIVTAFLYFPFLCSSRSVNINQVLPVSTAGEPTWNHPAESLLLLSTRRSRRSFVVYSSEILPPPPHLRKLLKEKKKNTQQGTPRFYLSLIYAAFSNCAIPAGVTVLLRSLGAILPAWVCQKPICMRPANVLEIKAPTCQVNSAPVRSG